MIVLSTMGTQMFGWLAARADQQLERRMMMLEKQMKEALEIATAQQELIMTMSKSLELVREIASSAVEDAHRADAIGLVTMTALAAVIAHVSAGMKPHPEAKRQLDLFLGAADKIVDNLAAERPRTAGSFQAQALRNLREFASAQLPKGPSPQ